MSKTFEMFLIDEGVLDASTLGGWMTYVRNSDRDEFDEIINLAVAAQNAPGADRNAVNVYTLFLAAIYPEAWTKWVVIRRLVG